MKTLLFLNITLIIKNTKNSMLKEIKALGIKTTDELDVKKAYELIEKKVGL